VFVERRASEVLGRHGAGGATIPRCRVNSTETPDGNRYAKGALGTAALAACRSNRLISWPGTGVTPATAFHESTCRRGTFVFSWRPGACSPTVTFYCDAGA